ncbi:MAG: hypothetical protein IPO92_12590 [Saprospiraceae bacterium]|nr:hypothetical protein [Saprospiraceae bacterium]
MYYKEHQKTLDPIEGLYNVFYDVLENKDKFTFPSESILLASDSAVWEIRKSGRDTFKIIEVIPHKKSTYFPDFTGYFIHKKQELPIDYIGENILFLHPFIRENNFFEYDFSIDFYKMKLSFNCIAELSYPKVSHKGKLLEASFVSRSSDRNYFLHNSNPTHVRWIFLLIRID